MHALLQQCLGVSLHNVLSCSHRSESTAKRRVCTESLQALTACGVNFLLSTLLATACVVADSWVSGREVGAGS